MHAHKPLAFRAKAESSGISCYIIAFTRIEQKPMQVIGVECPKLVDDTIIAAVLEVG
jgi:hypothetical protein